MTCLEIYEGQPVIVNVGPSIGLLGIAQHGQGQRLRTLKCIVSASEAQVKIVGIVLKARLGEQLVHPAWGMLPPAVLLERIASDKVIDILSVPASLEFDGATTK